MGLRDVRLRLGFQIRSWTGASVFFFHEHMMPVSPTAPSRDVLWQPPPPNHASPSFTGTSQLWYVFAKCGTGQLRYFFALGGTGQLQSIHVVSTSSICTHKEVQMQKALVDNARDKEGQKKGSMHQRQGGEVESRVHTCRGERWREGPHHVSQGLLLLWPGHLMH